MVLRGGRPRAGGRFLLVRERKHGAVPVKAGQTGVRSFAADHTGRICLDAGGENLCAHGWLPYGCTPVQ